MLGGNKRKAAPPLKKVVQEEETPSVDLPRPLFRGFIGGDAFITKKGYRGLKLESLWVQNIFEAFKTDDAELAAIALQSSLADVNDRVVGGVFGSPYSIGDHGFYSKKQFESQLVHLRERIKSVCLKNNHYLTTDEWDRVEKKLVNISNHSDAAFASTTEGDSFAALAIRQSAFQVAKVCMNAGIDPLVENVEGKDMFDVMKEQYHSLGIQLRDIQDLKVEATKKILVPTAIENMLAQEAKLIDDFHFLSEFADDLKVNLETRAKDIERDKILQRRAFLREESFPEKKLWNIEQQGKVERYLTEIVDLKNYIVEKIHYHESHAGRFESLSKLLLANYTLIDAASTADSDSASLSGTQSLESSTYASVSGSVSKSMSSRLRQSAKQKSSTVSLDKSLSVVSLQGEDDSSAVSGAIQAGFLYVDDDSVLTEEGLPSRIPKLPDIPNRLRNSRIDGSANRQMKSRFSKASKGVSTLTPSQTPAQTPARTASAEQRSDESMAQSPAQTPSYTPGIAEQSLVPRSTASSPARGGTAGSALPPTEPRSTGGTAGSARVDVSAQSKRSTVGFSTSSTPVTDNSGQIEVRMNTASSNGGAGFSPRLGTAPSTPGERMRQQNTQQGASALSTKEDLYALLGVADDDNSSVSSHGRSVGGGGAGAGGGYGGAGGGNSGIPISSAKLLARSMKDQYAPVLGTLKETDRAIIMYR